MNINELIKLRKSVRSWEDRPVDAALIEQVIDAARFAPSAKNGQEWRVVAVTNLDSKNALGNESAQQPFVAKAPVVLAICGDTSFGNMRCGQPRMPMDLGILIDHITLVAASEGLGTCWIGSFDSAKAAEIIGVPEGWVVAQLLPIGYPKDPSPAVKSRKSLGEVLSWEKW